MRSSQPRKKHAAPLQNQQKNFRWVDFAEEADESCATRASTRELVGCDASHAGLEVPLADRLATHAPKSRLPNHRQPAPSVRDSPDDLLILGPMVTGHAGATDGRDRRACHLNRRAPRKPRWQAWSTESGFPPCLTLGNWRRGGVHQQRPTLPVAPSCSEMAPPSGANAS